MVNAHPTLEIIIFYKQYLTWALEEIMDEKTIRKLDELTNCIDMELNILYCALKFNDKELEMAATCYFVESMYKKSYEIRKLF